MLALARVRPPALLVRGARSHAHARGLATAAPTPSAASLTERVQRAVTPSLVREYQANGACVVRGLFTPGELGALAAGIDANLADPSPRHKVASSSSDPGWFFEDFCNWQLYPAYRDFIFGSPAPSLAAALMGGEAPQNEVRLYHDHLLVKESGTRQRTPWHQDQPYYNISGRDNVSLWIPLDPVPASSTLEFVRGSHAGEWFLPRTFKDNVARWFPEGTLRDLPEVQEQDVLKWELRPGDCVAFHMLTLHAANGTENRRRAFSIRFMGDDTRHAPRGWVTSPEFPGLREELADGERMDHPLFPVAWRDGQQVQAP